MYKRLVLTDKPPEYRYRTPNTESVSAVVNYRHASARKPSWSSAYDDAESSTLLDQAAVRQEQTSATFQTDRQCIGVNITVKRQYNAFSLSGPAGSRTYFRGMSSAEKPIEPDEVVEMSWEAVKEPEIRLGGPSEWQPADSHIQDLANKVRSDVEANHGKGSKYVAKQYSWAVVAGTAYQILIRLDPGRVVNVRVVSPLKGIGDSEEPYLSEIG